MSTPPITLTAYNVGKWGLDVTEYDRFDPRGQLLVWEPPSPHADYVIGCDPTFGIVGWNRLYRSDKEEKHDNAAIEVFRMGHIGKDGLKTSDVQVAEWAGPLDAEDLADVCNFIGRLYGGRHEDQQALMAIEVYPGTGWITQRNLISKFGYTHLPPWLKEGKGFSQYNTGKYGWISNSSTRKDLWTRGASYLNRKKAILRSPHLVEEMVDCTPDNFLSATGRAVATGRHDDRVVAALIALWFCNEWEVGAEPTEPTGAASLAEAPDWQQSDVSYEDMVESWNDRVMDLQD